MEMEYAFIAWAIGTLPIIGKGMVIIGMIMAGLLLVIKTLALTEGVNLPLLRYLAISIPLICIGSIIPDKETAFAMAAAYGVQSVVENERVQSVANEGVLEAFLKKQKEELKTSVK
jgi:hypothetical protein